MTSAPDHARNRIFRAEAVERYARPIEMDVPELLVRWPVGLIVGAVALTAFALAIWPFG